MPPTTARTTELPALGRAVTRPDRLHEQGEETVQHDGRGDDAEDCAAADADVDAPDEVPVDHGDIAVASFAA